MACLVLPGLIGILVQGLLLACVVLTLIYKKTRDKSRRTWFDFGLDSSKQMCGATWIHCMNILFAEKLEAVLHKGDQCEWYWINIMVDTTLGVGVAYVYLHSIMCLLLACLGETGAADFQTGSYKDPLSGKMIPVRYWKQLVVWLIVVTGMKSTMGLFMVLCAQPLHMLAETVLAPFLAHDILKLLVVMLATPVIMNSLQFWIIDNIIKKKTEDDEVIDESQRMRPHNSRDPSVESGAQSMDILLPAYTRAKNRNDVDDEADDTDTEPLDACFVLKLGGMSLVCLQSEKPFWEP